MIPQCADRVHVRYLHCLVNLAIVFILLYHLIIKSWQLLLAYTTSSAAQIANTSGMSTNSTYLSMPLLWNGVL